MGEKKDVVALSVFYRVLIKMSKFGCNENFEDNDKLNDAVNENLMDDQDLIMEHILHNINHTPIGKVLKKIASLPEVSQKKVLGVRRQLNDGTYKLSERLNVAVDKILEDIVS